MTAAFQEGKIKFNLVVDTFGNRKHGIAIMESSLKNYLQSEFL